MFRGSPTPGARAVRVRGVKAIIYKLFNLPMRGYGHAKEPWHIEAPKLVELILTNLSKRVDNLQDAMFANRFIRYFVGYCFGKPLEHVPFSHCPDG